jgi:hypothetical protein
MVVEHRRLTCHILTQRLVDGRPTIAISVRAPGDWGNIKVVVGASAISNAAAHPF